jgi:hypothetical protein
MSSSLFLGAINFSMILENNFLGREEGGRDILFLRKKRDLRLLSHSSV